MIAANETRFLPLTDTTPIDRVPGVGRRTGKLLAASGVRTAKHFIALPDLLLETTFGPSMPKVRKQAAALLQRSRRQVRTTAGGAAIAAFIGWLLR